MQSPLQSSLAAWRPALFNPSLPNTESLNQGPAVFSARTMNRRKSEWSANPSIGNWHPCSVCCSGIGCITSKEFKWNQRAYICCRREDGFEIAEDTNRMNRVRLSMTQCSLEVLGKQICFFMCCDAFAQKIYVEDLLNTPCLALIFSLLDFLETRERSRSIGPVAVKNICYFLLVLFTLLSASPGSPALHHVPAPSPCQGQYQCQGPGPGQPGMPILLFKMPHCICFII